MTTNPFSPVVIPAKTSLFPAGAPINGNGAAARDKRFPGALKWL